MATQVQNRRGTTAEHSTFTGANGELTVDTTKRTLVVHDGATAGGRPLLREDQSNLPTSAPTTGIYNASGSLAISTNGTGRLFVDSSGRVGIGISPSSLLHTSQASGFNIFQQDSGSVGNYLYADSTGQGWVGTRTNHPFVFGTNNSERMKLDTSGRLGLGTSSPGAPLHVVNAGTTNNEPVIWGFAPNITSGQKAAIRFGKSSTSNEAINFEYNYDATTSNLSIHHFGDAYGSSLNINKGGRVGVGTTSPSAALGFGTSLDTVASNVSKIQLFNDGNSIYGLGVTAGAFNYRTGGSADAHVWYAGTSERFRCDGSGRLLVGTSSPVAGSAAKLQASTTANLAAVATYADNTAAKAGGLVAGDVYKKADGTLMITF